MWTSKISILISLGVLGLAQDLNGLPTCAQQAAIAGAGDLGCALTDASCLCNNSGFTSSLRAAITTACTSAADQQAACSWGNSACSQFGVVIPCDVTATDPAGATTSGAEAPVTTPTDMPMTTPTDGMDGSGVTTTDDSSISTPTDGSIDSMTSDMMSVSTIPDASITSMVNATMSANVTHAATNMPSTMAPNPTSQYTGAGSGSGAVKQGGIFGAVLGVALVFALF